MCSRARVCFEFALSMNWYSNTGPLTHTLTMNITYTTETTCTDFKTRGSVKFSNLKTLRCGT